MAKPDISQAEINRATRRAAVLVLNAIRSGIKQKTATHKRMAVIDRSPPPKLSKLADNEFGKGKWSSMNISPWLFDADGVNFLNECGRQVRGGGWDHSYHNNATYFDALWRSRQTEVVSYEDTGRVITLTRGTIYEFEDHWVAKSVPRSYNESMDILIGPDPGLVYPHLLEAYLDASLVRGRFVEVWTTHQGMQFSLTKPEAKDVIYENGQKRVFERVKKIVRNWDHLSKGERRMGIMLYGPPGTGKTATICELANELAGQVTIFSLKGGTRSSLLSIYDWLDTMGPNLVIVEDFDAIAPDRSSGGDEEFLSLLLNVLDGAKNHDVITIATTNHPDKIDGAAIRPGRLGLSVELAVPEPEHRKQIIEHYLVKYGLERINYKSLDRHGVLGCHVQSILHEVFVEAKLGGDPQELLEQACERYFASYSWKETGKAGF